MTLDVIRGPAVTAQELVQLPWFNPREDGGVGDLVAIEVQDRQHGAVRGWVEELVGVPGRGQRPGLGLAITDDAGDDEAGIIEHCAEGMTERVAELPAFMD